MVIHYQPFLFNTLKGPIPKSQDGYRSEAYSFDSTALERAAKAAKDLEKSKFATQALDLSKQQEVSERTVSIFINYLARCFVKIQNEMSATKGYAATRANGQDQGVRGARGADEDRGQARRGRREAEVSRAGVPNRQVKIRVPGTEFNAVTTTFD